MNKDKEIAWAAGLFEGEGCITADKRGYITITLTSTDLDVVERFQRALEVGVVRSKEITPRPDYRSQKPQYRWRLHRQDLIRQIIERDFWPYLGVRRKERWLELLSRSRYF